MNLAELSNFSYGSRSYPQFEQKSLFYSQSWALTHMLAMGSEYQSKFAKFLWSVSSGIPVPECFRVLFDETVQQVEHDLEQYIRRERLPVRSFEMDVGALAIQIESQPVSPEEIDVMLAEILALNPESQAAAETRLRELSVRYPANPKPEECLSYLALRQNRTEDARLHFALATARQSSDPDVLYRFAQLEEAAGAPPQAIIGLLDLLLRLEPDREDVRLQLGIVAAKARQYRLALSTLEQFETISRPRKFLVEYLLGYSYAQLGDMERAREHAAEAQRSVQRPAEQTQVAELLSYTDRAGIPGKH